MLPPKEERGIKWNLYRKVWKCQSLSCVWVFETPWTIACQASLSIEFSRQEYWSGLPFPSPGNLPNPGIKPVSLHLLQCRQILYHLSHQVSRLSFPCIGKDLPKSPSFTGKVVFHWQGYTYFHKVKWNNLFKYSSKCKKKNKNKKARRWSGCSPVSPLFSMNNHYRIRSCWLFWEQQTTAQRQTSWK